MALDETEQAIRCDFLHSSLESAQSGFTEQTDRLSGLQQQFRMEENQLRNLKEQSSRTGDREGFARAIFGVEVQIRRLQDDIADAESKQNIARQEVSVLKSQIANFRC